MKRVAVLFIDRFEEIEALTPVDLLRRAGIEVVMLGVNSDIVTGSHAISVTMDGILNHDTPADFDAVVIPGGPGASSFVNVPSAVSFITRSAKAGSVIAAICAAPAVVLTPLGLTEGKKITCYPGCEEGLTGFHFSQDRVVEDGALLTSRGPGTAAEFSLALVAKLVDRETAEKVRKSTLQPF